jgi:hypothetical protein
LQPSDLESVTAKKRAKKREREKKMSDDCGQRIKADSKDTREKKSAHEHMTKRIKSVKKKAKSSDESGEEVEVGSERSSAQHQSEGSDDKGRTNNKGTKGTK